MQNLMIKKITVLAIIAGLLALLTISSVNFYRFLKNTPESAIVSTDVDLSTGVKNSASARTIIGWHLFGKETVQQSRVPKTTLRLKLIGIISSSRDGQARVIIENASRQQKHYKVGDKIKNNVSVKSIHSDHIVILHNSREEIVPLKKLNSNPNLIKKVVIQ